MSHSLWGEQVTQNERAFLGEFSCVSASGCVRCVRAVFGGVHDRGYGSHGKESTKSDIVPSQMRGVGLVGVSEVPRH
jgi:hypothetical protein